jgi:hypothetical protein
VKPVIIQEEVEVDQEEGQKEERISESMMQNDKKDGKEEIVIDSCEM